MKKTYIFIVILFSLFVFIGNASADATLVCKAGNVTCTFSTTTISFNDACKDSNGKSYTTQNGNGKVPNEIINGIINNYVYQNGTSCPSKMLVNEKDKEIIFVNSSDSYQIPCDYARDVLKRSGLTCDNYLPNEPYAKATFQEALAAINYYNEMKNGSTYSSYNTTQESAKIDNDCDTQLQTSLNNVIEKQNIVHSANCANDVNANNCSTLLRNWHSAITASSNKVKSLTKNGVCTDSQASDMVKRLAEQTDDYNKITDSRKKITSENNTSSVSKSTDKVSSMDCSGLFGSVDNEDDIAFYMQRAFNLMKFLGPIFAVIMSILDLIKIVSEAKQEDQLMKYGSKTFKRVVYAFILFVLPDLINYVFGLIGLYGTCGIS